MLFQAISARCDCYNILLQGHVRGAVHGAVLRSCVKVPAILVHLRLDRAHWTGSWNEIPAET